MNRRGFVGSLLGLFGLGAAAKAVAPRPSRVAGRWARNENELPYTKLIQEVDRRVALFKDELFRKEGTYVEHSDFSPQANMFGNSSRNRHYATVNLCLTFNHCVEEDLLRRVAKVFGETKPIDGWLLESACTEASANSVWWSARLRRVYVELAN